MNCDPRPLPSLRNLFILGGLGWTGFNIYLATENQVDPWAIVFALLCFAVAVAFQYLIERHEKKVSEIELSYLNPDPTHP